MYLDEKKFEKSREAFTKAIAARSDSPTHFICVEKPLSG